MNKLWILGTNKEKLAEWFNKFNQWEYPDDFIVSKPKDWDILPNYAVDKNIRTKYTVSNPYMENICNIIGDKECLRYHHLHNLKVNNVQFELWWLAKKINGVVQKVFPNFYLDVYSILKMRD